MAGTLVVVRMRGRGKSHGAAPLVSDHGRCTASRCSRTTGGVADAKRTSCEFWRADTPLAELRSLMMLHQLACK